MAWFYSRVHGSAPLKKPLFLEKVDLVRLALSSKGSLEISLEVKWGQTPSRGCFLRFSVSLKKWRNPAIYNNVDESGGRPAKWSEPVTDDSTYMNFPK